jgi:thioesterase domain-containing protein
MSSTPDAYVNDDSRVPTAQDIEHYLHRYIPLSAAMGIRVKRATPGCVELAAPLGPNVNHHETLFGGSASAVATLSAWTLVHVGLLHANVQAATVIQRNVMNYDEPVRGDFTAIATRIDEPAWDRFLRTLERRGRARVTMTAHLEFEGRVVASFEGDFVALRSEKRS